MCFVFDIFDRVPDTKQLGMDIPNVKLKQKRHTRMSNRVTPNY